MIKLSNSTNVQSSVRYGVPSDDASRDSRSVMITLDMDNIEVIGLGGDMLLSGSESESLSSIIRRAAWTKSKYRAS